jgi:Domain of unknown function (DUF4336)
MLMTQLALSRPRSKDWLWPLWPIFPLYPYGRRQTLRTEVIKDTLWTFEQIQGVLYVVTPIRMTVVRLETGGLLVYAPVAPTLECLRLVRELEALHGAVKYIILPTVSGLEHKVFVGPFAQRFDQAQVFVAPSQWSFPLNLPLSWLGLPPSRTHRLPADCRQTPFADEFDYALLGPIQLGLGRFEEAAFFHRQSQTLLLTDTIVSVPATPPDVVQLDPYPLLFHARDSAQEAIKDTPAAREKGWRRIVLFTFYFAPGALEVTSLKQSLQDARHAPERSRKAYFGLFPFQWKSHWYQTFEAVRRGGRPLVAPVLKQLILNRAPQETLAWANRVASWDFKRIVSCHFAIAEVSPQQFLEAFSFLRQDSAELNRESSLDYQLLRTLEQQLQNWGVLRPQNADGSHSEHLRS